MNKKNLKEKYFLSGFFVVNNPITNNLITKLPNNSVIGLFKPL